MVATTPATQSVEYEAGGEFVEQHYDWERVFDPLDELLARFERG